LPFSAVLPGGQREKKAHSTYLINFCVQNEKKGEKSSARGCVRAGLRVGVRVGARGRGCASNIYRLILGKFLWSKKGKKRWKKGGKDGRKVEKMEERWKKGGRKGGRKVEECGRESEGKGEKGRKGRKGEGVKILFGSMDPSGQKWRRGQSTATAGVSQYFPAGHNSGDKVPSGQ
jgi:hypothetical protein